MPRGDAELSRFLFLDTNVFLSFFHFSNDDLERLLQLAVLVKRKRVKLLLPDQVTQEFYRNRDVKVAEAVKQIELAKMPAQFPRLCQDFPEYHELRSKLEASDQALKALIDKVKAAAASRELAADKTTDELFKAATVLEVTPGILSAADTRHRRGNPPGKQDKRESFGDGINWEALLAADVEGDLYLVAEDADWASALEPTAFNSFLAAEWSQLKGGDVHFYQRLSGFLGEHYPDIKLASELEKDILIDELAFSRNFDQTHRAIRALSQLGDFTLRQVNSIASAYASNRQVHWIVDDADVRDFLWRNVVPRLFEVDRPILEALTVAVEENSTDEQLKQTLGLELVFSPKA